MTTSPSHKRDTRQPRHPHISLPFILLSLTLCVNMVVAVPRVLVYTATRGYRHDSIPTAIEVLTGAQSSWGVEFAFTEDPGQFTTGNLATFDCLMFVHNSESVLDESGLQALGVYYRSGGNYVGVHSASACLQESSVYNQTVGAIFDYHPDIQRATFLPLNTSHPSTAHLPAQWSFVEEVYYFRSDPRSNGAQVLISVDENSYTNTSSSMGVYPFQGEPHPIAWFIDPPRSAQPLADGAPRAGRSFYTSLGHSNETWRDDLFQRHVQGGLQWALESRSTRAYGAGLVGNSNATMPSGGASGVVGASASASVSRSGSPSAASSAPAAASSTSGTGRGVVGGGATGVMVAAAAAIALGR